MNNINDMYNVILEIFKLVKNKSKHTKNINVTQYSEIFISANGRRKLLKFPKLLSVKMHHSKFVKLRFDVRLPCKQREKKLAI